MPSFDPTKAKELFTKPQSAVTDWIERICALSKESAQTDLNGFIIELVESINLQPTGPEEASRAIRKQLKHGRPAQQAKAITILDALVLNGGDRFKTTFADTRLIETLKSLISDPRADQVLKRRLLIMMEDWEKAYGTDPKMIVPASLFKSCGGRAKLDKITSSSTSTKPTSSTPRNIVTGINKPTSVPESDPPLSKAQLKTQKKQGKKLKDKLKSSHIDQRYRTDLPASGSSLVKFDLNQERPRILQALASASQSANNLVNRLQLISADQVANDTTIERLAEEVKLSQKVVIRYIHTVSEHDSEGEYLGTLLNTNAQVVSALDLYSQLSQSKSEGIQVDQVAGLLGKAKIATPEPAHNSEPNLFDDMNCAVDDPEEHHHPRSPADDLLGLDFCNTTSLAGLDNLPAPLTPNPVGDMQEAQPNHDIGTLSDYSDFDDSASSNEETTDETSGSTAVSPPTNNNPFYQHLSPAALANQKPLSPETLLDPFADPFADSGPNVATATHKNLVTSRVV